jgi:hypothetical protein
MINSSAHMREHYSAAGLTGRIQSALAPEGQMLTQIHDGDLTHHRWGPAHARRNRQPSSAVDEEFAHADHYVFCSNEAQVIPHGLTSTIAGLAMIVAGIAWYVRGDSSFTNSRSSFGWDARRFPAIR